MPGVGETLTFTIGDARLTRVPYFDIALPAEAVGLTAADVLAVDGVAPDWCEPDGTVRVGQVFWVIESDGRTIVVDPCCASDAFLRTPEAAVEHQTAAFAALTDAGFPRESVDAVIMSHLDGIGMHAWWTDDATWTNAFPNAPLLVSAPEVTRIDADPEISGRDAFAALREQGAVVAVDLPYAVTTDVRMVPAGGHTDGMAVVEVASGGRRALFTGHVPINPVHAGVTLRPELVDVRTDRPVLERWAADAASDGALYIAPLWPAPGAARVGSLDPIRFTSAWS